MELPRELEDAIVAAPNDREGYNVASDWLQQVGGPQGELVALSLAAGGDSDIIDRMIELEHELLPPDIRTLSPTAVEWRWGFVRGFAFNSVDMPDEPRMLRDFLVSPVARFLQKLVLQQANARIIEAIFDAAREPRALRCMRTLIVERQGTHAVNLELLSRALPSLNRLQLWNTNTTGVLDLPELWELRLSNTTNATAMLRGSQLPALEQLSVTRGDFDLREPNRWLAPARIPALRSLTVGVDHVVERTQWMGSAIGDQLEQLDVFTTERGRPTARTFIIDRRASSSNAALFTLASRGDIKPGTIIPIKPELFRIGRSKRAHLRLHESQIAMQHAELGEVRGHWHLRRSDMTAARFCYVNDHAIDLASLRCGDELTFGSYVFRLLQGDDIEQQAAKVRARYAL